MNSKTRSSLTILALFFSASTLAVQCENTKQDNSDDFNLNLSSTGLQSNGHILQGDALSLKAYSSWLHIGMKDVSTLNARLYLDGSYQGGHTAPLGSTSPSYTQTFTALSRGLHTAEAKSSTDSNCSTPQSSFVVQSAPSADANGNYSAVVSASDSSSTVTVNVSGTSDFDSDYSINKTNPIIKWKINGVNYSGDTASVDLPHGTYTAKFTVDDGTFVDSDTATITVIDQLHVGGLHSEMICRGNLGEITLDWTGSSHASYYDKEFKPSGGSWASAGTTTRNYHVQGATGVSVYDQFRVRACSSSKCGAWKTKGYYTPNCSNFNPN